MAKVKDAKGVYESTEGRRNENETEAERNEKEAEGVSTEDVPSEINPEGNPEGQRNKNEVEGETTGGERTEDVPPTGGERTEDVHPTGEERAEDVPPEINLHGSGTEVVHSIEGETSEDAPEISAQEAATTEGETAEDAPEINAEEAATTLGGTTEDAPEISAEEAGTTEPQAQSDVVPPETSAENPETPEPDKTQTHEEMNLDEDMESPNRDEEEEEVMSDHETGVEEDDVMHGHEEEDNEDDSTPLQPERFYFGPEQYTKVCKIGSRCSVKDTVNKIKEFPSEAKWFTTHSQFKHIFHMEEEPNRKSMGMWMLLLQQACTESKKELWFVVNGVPIRYSIREHALLCGLDCHDYPSSYKELKDKKKGDFKFVEKMFGRKESITITDVEEKLESMRSGVDKKKMVVLYFLSTVLKAKSKVKGNIEPFLLKVVDDLGLCNTFPWGRYTFDDCIEEVKMKMKRFKNGIVKEKDSWIFSGFILPLEAFAFECIPLLGRTFRVPVSAEEDCPRLCKHKFVDTSMKGYPLEDINEAIGKTKDIISILESDSDEEALMERILGEDCDDGIGPSDPIVELWKQHLIEKGQKIWWKDLYEMDLAGRVTQNVNEFPRHEHEQEPETIASLLELKEAMQRIVTMVKEIKEVVDEFDGRLNDVETFVKEHRSRAHVPSPVPSHVPSPVPSPVPSHVPSPVPSPVQSPVRSPFPSSSHGATEQGGADEDDGGEEAAADKEPDEELERPKKRTKKAPACYTPSEGEGLKKGKGKPAKKAKGQPAKNAKGQPAEKGKREGLRKRKGKD